MKLRKLEDIDFRNRKVFLRLDLNVPIKGGKIQDSTRIKAAIPTIEYIMQFTNKIAIASHLGRPSGEFDPNYSLEPVGVALAELINREVLFVTDYLDEPVEQILNQMSGNQIVLLENIRFHPGETKNDIEFSRRMINGFDIFVNDAFGTVHRAHASTVGMAECLEPSRRAAGYLIMKEVNALTKMMKESLPPFTAVVGGAKVSDKLAVILNLMNSCNNLLVGGAMAYTFLKYKGIAVGSSRVETESLSLVAQIYKNADARRVQIHLPTDHVTASEFSENADPVVTRGPEISDGMMGLDIGPKTIAEFQRVIAESKTVFWNGPMGVFEWKSFSKGSYAIAQAMAECSGYTVIGGGDSVSAVNQAGLADKMSHISTGGGASLELLEGRILPGLKVLLA